MPERRSAGLEHELEKLLDIEIFQPPVGFVAHQQPPARPAPDRGAIAAFWAEQARRLVDWSTPFTEVLDDSSPPFYRWFADGELNVSYNCLDRHVEAGRGDRVAYHWHGEEGEQRAVTYADLLRDVQRLANGLKSLGVEPEDVVGIYLPMIPEVVVAMLACARIGAVHNVVFGGFSVASVTERMEVSEAKVLITVDGARRKGKTAAIKAAVDAEIASVGTLQHIVVVRATGTDCEMQEGRDVWYDELCQSADPVCPPVALSAEHPLFILYSSGSTAKPKGILHTTGGYLTGVTYTHRLVFDLDPEQDIYWCAADVGWITGHSYIVYGPLSNGATSVMWEGAPDYPDKDIWWSLIERYQVTILYTAPTAIRACMKWGADYPEKHDLSSLRLLGSRRRADQPQGLALVPQGHRGRALPGRRHLVADRDRKHRHLPGARCHRHQAGIGHPAAPRLLGQACLRGRRGAGVRHRPAGARSAMAVDAAHPVPRRRAIRRDVLRQIRAGDVPRR